MGKVQVVRIPPDALTRITGADANAIPVIAYAGIEDGKVIASGGLAHRGDRWWIFLEIYGEDHHHPVYVVRWGRTMLKKAVQLDLGPVYAPMSNVEPRAAKLLTTLGFVSIGRQQLPWGGVHEIWVWGSA